MVRWSLCSIPQKQRLQIALTLSTKCVCSAKLISPVVLGFHARYIEQSMGVLVRLGAFLDDLFEERSG